MSTGGASSLAPAFPAEAWSMPADGFAPGTDPFSPESFDGFASAEPSLGDPDAPPQFSQHGARIGADLDFYDGADFWPPPGAAAPAPEFGSAGTGRQLPGNIYAAANREYYPYLPGEMFAQETPGSSFQVAQVAPEPPAYRAQVPAVRDQWGELRREADAYTPEKQHIYSRLFAAEGGVKSIDATGGILPSTLADLRRRFGPDLTVDTVGGLLKTYDRYFDDVLGSVANRENSGLTPSGLLDTLKDRDTAAPIADTLFRHGRGEGATLLQNALNAARGDLPMPEREVLNGAPLAVDGRMGPQTWGAIEELTRLGYGDALRHRLADLRTELSKGEASRFNAFR